MIRHASKRENVFELLASRQVFFKEHVELLLQTLGYQCVRTISMISDIGSIEQSIRLHLASNDRCIKMQDDEKIKLFGDFYADNPSDFSFLDGERISILVAVDMCKKILSEREDINRRESVAGKKRASQAATDVIAGTTVQENSLITATTVDEGVAGVRSRKKAVPQRLTLSQYVSRWMQSTKYPLDYSLQDCNIVSDQKKIVCNVCPNVAPFDGYVDALGRWKISSFTGHLVRRHLKQSSVTPESTPATGSISDLSNARHENTSSASSTGQNVNINESEKDDGGATPSKRLCTENLIEKVIEGEEISSRVDPLQKDF